MVLDEFADILAADRRPPYHPWLAEAQGDGPKTLPPAERAAVLALSARKMIEEENWVLMKASSTKCLTLGGGQRGSPIGQQMGPEPSNRQLPRLLEGAQKVLRTFTTLPRGRGGSPQPIVDAIQTRGNTHTNA